MHADLRIKKGVGSKREAKEKPWAIIDRQPPNGPALVINRIDR